MNKYRYLILLSTIALALSSRSNFAADKSGTSANPNETAATPATPATPAVPAVPGSPTVPATPAVPAKPAVPPVTGDRPVVGDPAGQGNPVDPGTKPAVPDLVRGNLEEAQKLRADYQSKKAELLKGVKGADAEAREEIRTKLKDNRDAYLAQQRQNRADLRESIRELKETLADHREVLDQAKEKAKPRKGGDE